MATAAPDNRGPTLVQKHRERMQAEKERLAVRYMSQMAPHISKLVRQMALELCEFETEPALQLIKDFQAEHGDQVQQWAEARRAHLLKLEEDEARRKVELEQLVQQQRAMVERERAGRGRDAGPRSDSSDSDSGSSSSSSDSDSDDSRRKSSRRKSSRKDKKKSKSKKRSKDRKEKDKKRKKDRKDRDRKEKKRSRRDETDDEEEMDGSMSARFGRYGIVRESDLDAKRPEFLVWAHEVKGLHIDNLPRKEEQELFKTFMEDYNTATLPHKKYYDLAKYEEEQRAKKARRDGDAKHEEQRKFVLDDEAARQQEIMDRRRQEAEERLRQAYVELKTTGKAEDMRHQEELKAKLAMAYKTGDVKTAENILDRLRKDDDKYKGRAGARPAK